MGSDYAFIVKEQRIVAPDKADQGIIENPLTVIRVFHRVVGMMGQLILDRLDEPRLVEDRVIGSRFVFLIEAGLFRKPFSFHLADGILHPADIGEKGKAAIAILHFPARFSFAVLFVYAHPSTPFRKIHIRPIQFHPSEVNSIPTEYHASIIASKWMGP